MTRALLLYTSIHLPIEVFSASENFMTCALRSLPNMEFLHKFLHTNFVHVEKSYSENWFAQVLPNNHFNWFL